MRFSEAPKQIRYLIAIDCNGSKMAKHKLDTFEDPFILG